MNPTMNIAQQAVRQAGRVLLRQIDVLNDTNLIESKRERLVQRALESVQTELKESIKTPLPDHVIVFPGETHPERAKDLWIIHGIDPISHYERALPHYAVSMSWYHKGELKGGLVYDPILDECFSAIAGNGAQLNQHRIRVASKGRRLNAASVANRFPKDRESVPQHTKAYTAVAPHIGSSAQSDCASLSMAYVACGRFDAYWQVDNAGSISTAALLIAKEAGAMVSNWKGKSTLNAESTVLVATPACYPDLQKLLVS